MYVNARVLCGNTQTTLCDVCIIVTAGTRIFFFKKGAAGYQGIVFKSSISITIWGLPGEIIYVAFNLRPFRIKREFK